LNAGPSTVFVRWGTGAQTALTTDMPILAGSVEVFTTSPLVDTIAAITASSTATLYITCGEGQ
jgi:PKD repeat protein